MKKKKQPKLTRRYSAKKVAKRIEALGEEIRKDAGKSDILLLGILKGSAVFLADLLRAIPGKVDYEFIDVVRDVTDTEIADSMEIDFLTHFDMQGKVVYLLKDVVSTGVIESYLLSQLRLRKPADLKLVALLDRPDLRTMDLKIDFRAFKATVSMYVGYGLEHGGEFGNLPYIATIG